jgi:hypothetical protein
MGIKASEGNIIFLTDSKVLVEAHALENAKKLMQEHKVSVVGGITPAWPNQKQNFWARLTDKALVSNIPTFQEIGFLTKKSFGQTESLPVTTALMFTRSVFEKVSEDFALEFSKVAATYDDYVLAWLIVDAGFKILVTNTVVAHHLHRTSWKRLLQTDSTIGAECRRHGKDVSRMSVYKTSTKAGMLNRCCSISVYTTCVFGNCTFQRGGDKYRSSTCDSDLCMCGFRKCYKGKGLASVRLPVFYHPVNIDICPAFYKDLHPNRASSIWSLMNTYKFTNMRCINEKNVCFISHFIGGWFFCAFTTYWKVQGTNGTNLYTRKLPNVPY